MTGSCPPCRTAMDLTVSGAYGCPRCRRRFEVYLAAPAAPGPLVPAQRGEGEGGARCALHGSNLAEGVCERCGDFMCALCATPFEGRRYCPGCFDLLWER